MLARNEKWRSLEAAYGVWLTVLIVLVLQLVILPPKARPLCEVVLRTCAVHFGFGFEDFIAQAGGLLVGCTWRSKCYEVDEVV
jgi:hypothetical protein